MFQRILERIDDLSLVAGLILCTFFAKMIVMPKERTFVNYFMMLFVYQTAGLITYFLAKEFDLADGWAVALALFCAYNCEWLMKSIGSDETLERIKNNAIDKFTK